jgi:hypothetical protein
MLHHVPDVTFANRRVVQVERAVPLVILGLDEPAHATDRRGMPGQVLALLFQEEPGDGYIASIQGPVKSVPATFWVLQVDIYRGVCEQGFDEREGVFGSRGCGAEENRKTGVVTAVDLVPAQPSTAMATAGRRCPLTRILPRLCRWARRCAQSSWSSRPCSYAWTPRSILGAVVPGGQQSAESVDIIVPVGFPKEVSH